MLPLAGHARTVRRRTLLPFKPGLAPFPPEAVQGLQHCLLRQCRQLPLGSRIGLSRHTTASQPSAVAAQPRSTGGQFTMIHPSDRSFLIQFLFAASPSIRSQSRAWKTWPGFEPGSTDYQLGALTTVLSDTSTIKTFWDEYIGFIYNPLRQLATIFSSISKILTDLHQHDL